jgi:hypothetical protein
MCFLAGVLISLVDTIRYASASPKHYYPVVNFDKTVVLLYRNGIRVANEDSPEVQEAAAQAEQRNASVALSRVWIVYERSIPYRLSWGHRSVTFQPLDPSHRPPTREELRKMGPERRLAIQFYPEQSAELTAVGWPDPTVMKAAALPLLAEEMLRNFGDADLARDVRLGGVVGPILPKPPQTYGVYSAVLAFGGLIGVVVCLPKSIWRAQRH